MSLPLIELGQFIVNLSTTELMYVVRCADDEFKRRNGSINSILTIHQQQQQQHQPHVQTYASIVTSNLFPVTPVVEEQKEKDKQQQPDTEANQKNKNEEKGGEEEDDGCSSDPQKEEEEEEEQENIDHMTLYVKNEREHKDQKEFRKLLIDTMKHKKPIAHIWVDPKGRYSFVSFHETTKDDNKNKKIALTSKQLLEGAKINVAFAHQREKKEKK